MTEDLAAAAFFACFGRKRPGQGLRVGSHSTQHPRPIWTAFMRQPAT